MLLLHLRVDCARLFFFWPRLLTLLVSFCTWKGKETLLTLCTVTTHLKAVEERIPSRSTLCKHSAKSLDLHIFNQWGLGKIKGGNFHPDCSLSESLGGVRLFMLSLRKNVLKVWCWVVLCLQKKPPVWEYWHMAGRGMCERHVNRAQSLSPMQLRQTSGPLRPPKGAGTGFEGTRAKWHEKY